MMWEGDIPDRDLRATNAFGWWSETVRPETFVDLEWDADERERMASYLNAANACVVWAGRATCRMGCQGWIGSTDKTDGVWTFPEGLAHYVRVHRVKPPAEFLDHIRSLHR